MTWYQFLLFVHVAGAIVWIGGGFYVQMYGMIELRSGDPTAIARFAGMPAASASACSPRRRSSSCSPGSG